MTEDELDKAFDKRDAFAKEFRQLVLKHMPEYPRTDDEHMVLEMMQEMTSCYSPYIWSNDNDAGDKNP